ncbi:BrnT family toxin [Nitrosomonas sp. Nm34]|uniref:BrnT family toxin n=1 Tax=Nitrosomonas sp. Nm34 TaxID=1881055 RepID=UPI0008F1912C|nr:BrnT family toxin [Nitrosomonas sp. Nm34]SFJ05124.1 hypothetical protein SAMN05428978_10903 [Nitrosomonas sp. Nm34]
MKIVFDQTKNSTNLAKHGVPLSLALMIEWDTLLAKQDERKEYGEKRMIGYALVDDRLYCVVFTDRDNERRIISLRKANQREVKYYVSQN